MATGASNERFHPLLLTFTGLQTTDGSFFIALGGATLRVLLLHFVFSAHGSPLLWMGRPVNNEDFAHTFSFPLLPIHHLGRLECISCMMNTLGENLRA